MTASRERATPPPVQGVRIPDFFIVGHHKSGTTALYEMLREHPQIYMPDLKEPRYFASDMNRRFQPARGRELPETWEEYLALFAGAQPGQRSGEASPSYLWSRTAARRIAEVRPDARIIAILREPASFLRSLHLEFLRSRVEATKDLRKAMSLEAARRSGKRIPRSSHVPQLLQYSDHVRYVDQLRRYDAVFPKEQLLVIIYDDFRADNPGTLRSVLRFLEVDEDHPIDALDVHPTTLGVRSVQLDDLVHSFARGQGPTSRAARRMIKALTPRGMRRETSRALRRRVALGEPQPLDEQFVLELRRRFKPEVVALSDYLERDLVSLWGYGELA